MRVSLWRRCDEPATHQPGAIAAPDGAAILQPLTRDDGMRPETADGRSMAAVAESFIAPNSRLSAFERLEIYNRQYWFR